MNKKNQLIVALIIIALLALLYFLIDENHTYQIVKLKGANVYSNLSKSYMACMVGNNSEGISAMPLCENDILYLVFEEDEKEFCYRYQKKDGNNLEFKKKNFKLLLNNKLISIQITDDEELNNWLENLTLDSVKDLRSVFISDEISGVNMKHLARLSELKPEIGVYIDSQAEETDSVLKLFNPLWLIDFNKAYSPEAIQVINRSGKLDLLRIDANLNNLNEFTNLNKLKILFIQNLDQPETIRELKLPKGLRTLIISESGISSLDFLNGCNHLRELGLIDCESLTDISALNSLPMLNFLHLIACDSLHAIHAADQIKRLKWMSFPDGIDQQEFDLFLAGNQFIEVIDLISCDSIKSFTRLKELKQLSCLSIHAMEVHIDSVIELTNLKYLSLPGEIMDDSASVSLLKEKLPETMIVPSAGICLGTGWILVFIPLLIISGLCVIHFRKTGYGKNAT